MSKNPVTRMLVRLNHIMKNFKAKNEYPILFVVDRMGNRNDVVVLIVDVLHEDRKYAEEVFKKVVDHLSSHNIKVVGYTVDSYMVPFKEVWRFAAMVAVDSQ